MKKVLITDDVHPLLLRGLEKLGFNCDYQPKISNDETHRIIFDYDGLIINSKIWVDKALLDAAPRLLFVGRVGSGMEIVDKKYAAQKGVAVLSSPEGNRNAVAEHALGMLLALINNMNRAHEEVKNLNWQREKNRGFELMGKTIGIVGFGNTGSAFASKLLTMGMRILTFDKYLPQGYLNQWHPLSMHAFPMSMPDGSDENWHFSTLQEVDFEQIMSESDIISFHLPLTDEVIGLADSTFFQKCKKNILLINTSRGRVVRTPDLVEALRNGKVKGACLDVFENEKTDTYTEGERALYNALFLYDNVLLSPHIAGWTHESKERLASVLLARIEESLKNRRRIAEESLKKK
ncbi:MAG: hypothetical protein HC817_00225 [Saprospiraceae bacterium]|nr:hypothetical protein [Saprospiraceae bacterium]